jgi:hypothetical protein
MGNTAGGLVLIGVEEEDSRPKLGGWPMLPRSVGSADQQDALSNTHEMRNEVIAI